ncbi:AMP-binding enzyme [Spirosoma telluris]|uniref:AMP-binding enzyme n=1 Tax=Spirosoma telluris TaxID=2183553 RepID=UPI002FC2D54C
MGEIEVLINQLNGVKQAVVVAREGADGQKRLVAYLVATDGHVVKSGIRAQLEEQLPDYMMPSAFVWLDELPKTTSGKVDKKQLPAPEQKRPDLAVAYRKPRTPLEQTIAGLWIDLLQVDKVGLDDNFFELGGNSLLAQKTVAALKLHQQTLPVTKLYQFPTIAGIANFLQPQKRNQLPEQRRVPKASLKKKGHLRNRPT